MLYLSCFAILFIYCTSCFGLEAGTFTLDDVTKDPGKACQHYNANGFVKIANYLTQDHCNQILKEIEKAQDNLLKEIVEKSFPLVYFKNLNKNYEYFLNSAFENRIFFENNSEKPNKIGHAFHLFPKDYPKFNEAFYDSEALRGIFQGLGYAKPICAQTMYIAKAAEVGGEVQPHQDSTYLYTVNSELVGVWIALEDASQENGCLWGIPGSHKQPLYSVLKVDHNQKKGKIEKFEVDGEIPNFSENIYTPLPAKKGDALIFHGRFIHYSAPNTSNKSRPAITFHAMEGASYRNIIYPDWNWLKLPDESQRHFLY